MTNNVNSNIVLWACAILIAIGAGIVFRPLVIKLLDLVQKPFSKPKIRRSIEDLYENGFDYSFLEQDSSVLSRILRSKVFWAGLGLIISFLLWNKISSPVVFVLIYAIGSIFGMDKSIEITSRLDTQVDSLISLFRSRLGSSRSIEISLNDIVPLMSDGMLKMATEKVCRLLKAEKSFRQSFYPWLLFDHPMLSRFAFLLSSANGLSPDKLGEILEAFQKNQQNWTTTREESRKGIGTVVLLMKSMLVITAGILGSIAFLPKWQAILTGSVYVYTGFLVALTLLFGCCIFIHIEAQRLESA